MNNFYYIQIKSQKKEQELFYVLEEYFNRPHQYKFDDDGNISAFIYSNAEGKPMLEISLTKKGRLDKISSQLSEQEAKALEKQIKLTILNDNGHKIGQTICFITGTVESFYHCDHFQILPIPSDAPKSEMLSNTPFLLQFTYPTSPDWRIDSMRRLEREQYYINLLTLLLHTYITTNPPTSSMIWTYDFDTHHAEKRFPLYLYEGFSPSIDTFTDTSKYQPNSSIPAKDFYTGMLAFRNVMTIGQHELKLPDNLCESFEKIHSLNEKDRKNFYRACHWLRHAQIQLPISKSLSLIALITAIECLIDKKQCSACKQERVIASERCKVCGEPIYKITQAFKEFVESLLPTTTHNQKALSLLYNTRSSLVHGSEILQADSHPWVGFTENKRAFDEYSIYDQAYILTKIVLYLWLHRK